MRIDPELVARRQYMDAVRAIVEERSAGMGRPVLAFTHHFGCQQNISDGERLDGMLLEMGFGFTSVPERADLVLYNTCAVRENAEDRVFGNVGALKKAKRDNPELIICLCGCMIQQESAAEKIKRSYPYVDILCGPSALPEFPRLLFEKLSGGKQIFCTPDPTGPIAEGLPVLRAGKLKTGVPIMYGCDNFCAYCVVPYVRGRERSRAAEDILAEIRGLVEDGYKEITLLGQNVNSYRNGDRDFVSLLREIDDLPGDFRLRFMTSHPKDCSRELIDFMAESRHIPRHLHLPVQSGSDRILTGMNRRYTADHYRGILEYARARMPDCTFTSDVIVGFPGEIWADVQETIGLIREMRFLSLFTFLYSKREGTAAAKMDDPVPESVKKEWFSALLDIQNKISKSMFEAQVGKLRRVLVEGPAENAPGMLTGRDDSNLIVRFPGAPALIGTFRDVRITKALHWALEGALADS